MENNTSNKKPRKTYKYLYELTENYKRNGKRSLISMLKKADKIIETWPDLDNLSNTHIQEVFDFFSFCVNYASLEEYTDDIAEAWPDTMPLCVQIGAPLMHELAERASQNLWELLTEEEQQEIMQLKNTIMMFKADKVISFMINYDSYRITMPEMCSEEDYHDYEAELLNRCVQLVKEGGSAVVRVLDTPNKLFGVVARNGIWAPIPKASMQKTYGLLTDGTSICDDGTEAIEVNKIVL